MKGEGVEEGALNQETWRFELKMYFGICYLIFPSQKPGEKTEARIVQDVFEEETMLMRNAVVLLTAIGLPVLALPLVSCVVVETA